MNVPIAKLVVETMRAVWSRPVWALITVAACAAVGAGLAAIIVDDAHTISARQDLLTARGWGLVVVSSAAGETLDPRACAEAAGVDGVIAAGPVSATRDVKALGLDAGLSVTEVSIEVVRMSWPESGVDLTTAGLLTPGLQSLAGLGGGVFYLREGGVSVPVRVSRLDAPGRYQALDGGLLIVRSEIDSPSYCLVDVPPEEVENLALDIAAATVSFGTISVPSLSPSEASPTPGELVQQHRDRHFPLIAGAFLLIITAVRLLRSRRDRAIYRLLRFGRADLWTMGIIEYMFLMGVPVMSAFATVLLADQGNRVPTQVLGLREAALLCVVSTIVAVAFASLSAVGRNTHQFAPGA